MIEDIDDIPSEIERIGLLPKQKHGEKNILKYYQKIKILWDDDKDTRIYWAIDRIIELVDSNEDAINSILWVGESKGVLTIAYDNNYDGTLAAGYLEDFIDFDVPDGDFWIVRHEFPRGEWKHKKEELYEINSFIIPPRIITSHIRYEVCRRQRWKCNNCHVTLKFHKTSEWDGELAHIDHIHPHADAMTYQNGYERINESSNLQALCQKCNLSKSRTKN